LTEEELQSLTDSGFTPNDIRKIGECVTDAFERLQAENKKLAKSKSDAESRISNATLDMHFLKQDISSQKRKIVELTRKLRAAEQSREAIPVVSREVVVEDGELPVATVVT